VPLPIYLDYNATTPVAPEVAEAIQPFLFGSFGNPSSAHHYGREAGDALATARHQVARLIGAHDDEIVFTGNATEANNLAVLGAASAISRLQPTRRRVVISAVEHPAVTEPVNHLVSQGWRQTLLRVDAQGKVNMQSVWQALDTDTALVSVMHANNEVGTIQPVAAIAARARELGVLVHTDAAQTVGKVEVDVRALGVDLLSIAGHKLYAPKGVGALYVRRGTPIESIVFGAGQEHGLRPGTENVALAVGLGAAAELARSSLAELQLQMRRQRDSLHQKLAAAVIGLRLNGDPVDRLPNTLNVSFPHVDGAALLAAAVEVAASTGSACHSESRELSGVLAAMGLGFEEGRGAVRLSVGRGTTDDEIDQAAAALIRAWHVAATQTAAA
jgi:cysteine desulfurase